MCVIVKPLTSWFLAVLLFIQENLGLGYYVQSATPNRSEIENLCKDHWNSENFILVPQFSSKISIFHTNWRRFHVWPVFYCAPVKWHCQCASFITMIYSLTPDQYTISMLGLGYWDGSISDVRNLQNKAHNVGGRMRRETCPGGP